MRYSWIFFVLFALGCVNRNLEDLRDPEVDLDVNDFLAFTAELPALGDTLGFIDAKTKTGTLSFSLDSTTPEGAIAVNATTGAVTVANSALFVFADNPQIESMVTVSNNTEEKTVNITINVNQPGAEVFNIWTGPALRFSKEVGADPNDEANQDLLTDNVILTRGNSGGGLYNVVEETSFNKGSGSPAGTRWAIGTVDNIANLTFQPLNDNFGNMGAEIVDTDMVLHLVEDDVYISVKFSVWSRKSMTGAGGFSYDRSTEN